MDRFLIIIQDHIPTTMIICEVLMDKLKFVVAVVDRVIRIAELLKAGAEAMRKRNELSKDKQESDQD